MTVATQNTGHVLNKHAKSKTYKTCLPVAKPRLKTIRCISAVAYFLLQTHEIAQAYKFSLLHIFGNNLEVTHRRHIRHFRLTNNVPHAECRNVYNICHNHMVLHNANDYSHPRLTSVHTYVFAPRPNTTSQARKFASPMLKASSSC